MGARFVILIVLCTIFHNTQSLIQYTNPEWPSVFSQFFLAKIANFGAWYKEYKGEGKPDLDKIKISEEDKPMNLQTHEYSMYTNISLTIKDSNLMNFGAKLHPLQLWSHRKQLSEYLLTIQYGAANVSYTGNFASTGTLLNKTISFDGEGQFDMKIHILCNAYVTLKIGAEIPVKVSNQSVQDPLCYVSGTGPINFSGILKKASPEIKESNRARMERLLSSSLGTPVKEALALVMLETKRKMMNGIFRKQVEDAMKDVTIFDVINEWKPKYNDSVYGNTGNNGQGVHYWR